MYCIFLAVNPYLWAKLYYIHIANVYTIYFETLCRVLFPKKIGLVADYVHILDYRLITFIFWMSG